MLALVNHIPLIAPANCCIRVKLKQVAFVEKDTKIQLFNLVKQSRAPWGLGRISHRKRSRTTDYIYDSSGGKGIQCWPALS